MKILMVCLGNICRSPLAHGVLEHLANRESLNWEIDSAGTGDWHVGNQPDTRSIAVARKFGIDISNQCCRLFDPADFEYYDRILVMDRNNLKDVISLARNEHQKNKVSLFLENDVVPDPYYDDNQFEPVYLMIEKRCKEIIEDFNQKKASI